MAAVLELQRCCHKKIYHKIQLPTKIHNRSDISDNLYSVFYRNSNAKMKKLKILIPQPCIFTSKSSCRRIKRRNRISIDIYLQWVINLKNFRIFSISWRQHQGCFLQAILCTYFDVFRMKDKEGRAITPLVENAYRPLVVTAELKSLESLFEKVIKIINNKTFKQFNYEKSN